MFGGGAENQQRQPLALGVEGGVVHLFAHRLKRSQIMVLFEQLLKAAALLAPGHQHDLKLFQNDLFAGGGKQRRSSFSFHTADYKKFAAECPAKSAITLFFMSSASFMHRR